MRLTAIKAVAEGFLLSEMMISTVLFAAISLGLLIGFIALERNYTATSDFAMNHADQMRISDYLALDLRRALSLKAARNDTTIYIPKYYERLAIHRLQRWTEGGVYYGAAGSSLPSTITCPAAQSSATKWRHPRSLAVNVQDFVFDVTDAGKVVSTRITFNPTFGRAGLGRRHCSDSLLQHDAIAKHPIGQ